MVDDDALVSASVVAYLEVAGFVARVAPDSHTGELAWRSWRPDAVILDVLLPGVSGLELLRRMRRDADGTPVVLLSGLGTMADRIAGLEVGADDYLTKPFSPRELVLRIEALLRRGTVLPVVVSPPIAVGPLVLDLEVRTATLAGKARTLTPREFELLAFLARHAGQTFSRRELLRRVWEWDFGDDSTVIVHIRRLRKKFEPDPSRPVLVTTVRGAGYRLGTGAELDALLGGSVNETAELAGGP
jgi:DNA-binding response OmpR family regulator